MFGLSRWSLTKKKRSSHTSSLAYTWHSPSTSQHAFLLAWDCESSNAGWAPASPATVTALVPHTNQNQVPRGTNTCSVPSLGRNLIINCQLKFNFLMKLSYHWVNKWINTLECPESHANVKVTCMSLLQVCLASRGSLPFSLSLWH